MRYVLPAETAVLLKLESVGNGFFVFCCCVVTAFTNGARHCDYVSHVSGSAKKFSFTKIF